MATPVKPATRAANRNVTLWFTGMSGAGKTTIATALVRKLRFLGYQSKNLDGDDFRNRLNSDLGFSVSDREENIRRVAEVAAIVAELGVITVVSLISPLKKARDTARKIHEKRNLLYLECFVDTPLEECERRDPKGLYQKCRKGQISDFTGIDSPYEKPSNSELVIKTMENKINESVDLLIAILEKNGCIDPIIKELFVEGSEREALLNDLNEMPKLDISQIDLQWVQVLSEGWATPLGGFMREKEYIECIFHGTLKEGKVNQTIPIVLAVKALDKDRLEKEMKNDKKAISLWYRGKCYAILENPEFYLHRKEERCARTFSTTHLRHPTIEHIMKGGEFLVGGDLKVLERIKWNDGLDEYRLKPMELRKKFQDIEADAVYAFQVRNPIHNGHALLMQDTRKQLIEKGFKKPILFLHPLGGWTKGDDVPLGVRIKQHKAVLEDGLLDANSTVLSIFPSPMSYAGPVEVQWHCKARLVTGANFYIVGRDPAGIPHPDGSGDLYHPEHGREVLKTSQGLEQFEIISFKPAAYDKERGCMNFYDETRKDKYEFISGTKMRNLAKRGENPPEGFMSPRGWKVLADYYREQSQYQCISS